MTIESWVLLAFLVPIIMAGNLIVNKVMLTKLFPDSVAYLMLLQLSTILFLVPGYFLVNTSMSPGWLVISLLVGFIFSMSFYFQNKVTVTEEASKVAILTRLTPIFALPLAAIFLGEILTPNQYLGIVLLALGGIVVSLKEFDWSTFRFSKPLIYITFFNFLIASITIARKFILDYNNYWPVVYWTIAGSFLAGLVLMLIPRYRKRFTGLLIKADHRVYILRTLTLFTFVVGSLLTSVTLKEGYVTIVLGARSIQPLVVLLFASILTWLLPNVLAEDLSSVSLRQKIVAIILVFIGGWLVLV